MVGPVKKLVETNAIVMSSGLILHFPYVSVEVSFYITNQLKHTPAKTKKICEGMGLDNCHL